MIVERGPDGAFPKSELPWGDPETQVKVRKENPVLARILDILASQKVDFAAITQWIRGNEKYELWKDDKVQGLYFESHLRLMLNMGAQQFPHLIEIPQLAGQKTESYTFGSDHRGGIHVFPLGSQNASTEYDFVLFARTLEGKQRLVVFEAKNRAPKHIAEFLSEPWDKKIMPLCELYHLSPEEIQCVLVTPFVDILNYKSRKDPLIFDQNRKALAEFQAKGYIWVKIPISQKNFDGGAVSYYRNSSTYTYSKKKS